MCIGAVKKLALLGEQAKQQQQHFEKGTGCRDQEILAQGFVPPYIDFSGPPFLTTK
jgi:hypothetical protein